MLILDRITRVGPRPQTDSGQNRANSQQSNPTCALHTSSLNGGFSRIVRLPDGRVGVPTILVQASSLPREGRLEACTTTLRQPENCAE